MNKPYFLAILLVIVAGSAFGYTPLNHDILTRHAAEVWNEHHPNNTLNCSDIQWLVNGNRDEDEKNHGQRLSNWHFYKPHPTMTGREKRSSVRRIKLLIDRLGEAQKKGLRDSILYWTGAVMHHVQDLTNPAHVAPTFHGAGIKDQFDQLFIDCTLLPLAAIPTNVGYSSYFDIIDQTAIITFASLDQTFEVEVTKKAASQMETHTWQSFYEVDRKHFMGSYGILGKRRWKNVDAFGMTTIKKGKKTYTIDASIYTVYRASLLELAVKQSYLLLDQVL